MDKNIDMKNKKNKENPLHLMKRLLGYILKNYKFSCIAVLVCILVSALTTLIATLFIQKLIDSYIIPLTQSAVHDYAPLAGALIKLAAVLMVGVLCSYCYNRIMVNVGQGTLKKLRLELFTNMESLPVKYFDTHAHGDIMSVYTNDIDTLRQLISQSIPQVINSCITLVSTFVSMIVLDIPLTIVSVVMVVIMLYVTSKLSALSGKYFVEQQKDIGKVNAYIEEMMEGQKVVKVFCHEDKSIEQFKEINNRLRESANNANKVANITMPVNGNIGNISYVLCAIVGGILALSDFSGLTIGTLVAFLSLNKSFTQPVTQISQQVSSIVMAMAGAGRVFELCDEKPEVDEGFVELVNVRYNKNNELIETEENTEMWAWKKPAKDGSSAEYTRLAGDVTFDGVDFGYNPDKMVLHDIKMYATPGQKIAFVGSTGAGKTTITNLINRFYDIQDGKIRYDGININNIKKNDLNEYFIFPGFVDYVIDFCRDMDVFAYLLTENSYATTENSLIEAMSVGLPIVVLDNPVERSIIKDKINGRIVKSPEEFISVLEWLRCDDNAKKLGESAREYCIRSYSSEHYFNEFYKICIEGIKKKKHILDLEDIIKDNPFENFLFQAVKEKKLFKQLIKKNNKKILKKIPDIYKEKNKGSIRQFAKYFPECIELQILERRINNDDN